MKIKNIFCLLFISIIAMKAMEPSKAPDYFSAIKASNEPSYIKNIPAELRIESRKYVQYQQLIDFINSSPNTWIAGKKSIRLIRNMLHQPEYEWLATDPTIIGSLINLIAEHFPFDEYERIQVALDLNTPGSLEWLKLQVPRDNFVKVAVNRDRIQATLNGDLAYVKKLIQAGADINAKDYFSRSPLLIAVQKKNIPMIKLLLENGADILATDAAGNRIVDIAKQDNIDLMKMIEEITKEKTNKKRLRT